MNQNNKIKNNKPEFAKTEQPEENTEQQLAEEVEKYKDVEGLTTKKLNFGLWYVKHRQFFKKIIIACLIAVSAVSWSYTLYGLAYYVVRGMDEDELLVRQLLQTNIVSHDYLTQIGAQDLRHFPVNVLMSANNKYDLAARVQNINERWYAEFDYYFLAGGEPASPSPSDKPSQDGSQGGPASLQGGKIGLAHSFILPMEEKYLMALSQEFGRQDAGVSRSKPNNVQLVIENLSWSRINRHKIPDWQDYKNSRLNIIVKDIKFIPASQSKLSEGETSTSRLPNLNQVNFKAINKTAYNYWQVDFQIALFRGMDIVGINRISLNEFMSGQERLVEIRWPGKIGRVGKAEAMPELNIMRDDIYIKYEGEIEEDK